MQETEAGANAMFTLMEVVRHVFHANLEAEAQSHLVPCVFCSKNSKD